MSDTIEQKVVEMRFNNKQFEKNVQTSMSTIDSLKQKLNFSGATKGLESINTAANKINMSGVGAAIESVQAKFSSLEVIGVTTLANITNSVVNAGKKIASALTIAPVSTGFQEYETQIGAVQTILANTQHEGTNLQQVNRALDELNKYADKTIYNFTEMTRNIGTFTAAGVKLQTSVDSIKGIANLAAISGSTSQQASTAMYQLSQALAAGKVSLMDWNSVVNAGMGGKVFQDALIRTSELLGTNAKAAIDTYGSFRESLSRTGWLTTEVLTETLKQFAGAYSEADLIAQGFTQEQAAEIAKMAKTAEEAATKVKTFTQLWDTLKESAQSGWTQTWEIVVGDFEEAKDLLTDISNTIGNIISRSADARNALLTAGLSSGWKQLLNAGIADEAGYIESIHEVAKKSGSAFDDLVTSVEKEGGSFQDALKKALETGTIDSDTLSDAVSNLQKKMTGMSAAERKAAGYTSEMIEQITELDAELKNGTISMDEFTNKILRPSGRENIIQALWNSFNAILSIATPVKEAFREIFPAMTGEQLYGITEKLREFTEKLILSADQAEKVKSIFKGLFSILDIGKQAISAVLKPFITFLGGDSAASIGNNLLTAAAALGDFFTNLNEGIKAGNTFSVISDGLSSALDLLGATVSKLMSGLGGFGDAMSGIWNIVRTVGGKIKNVLGDVISWISDNVSAGDIFAGLVGGGIFMAAKKFSGLLDKIKGIFDGFGKGGEAATKFSDIMDSVHSSLEAFQQGIKVASLIGIATAVMLLSSAMRTISELEIGEVTFSLIAIRLMIASLNSGFKSMSKTLTKFPAKKTIATGVAMMAMAKAVDILASAMLKFKDLSWSEIAKGLVGVGSSLLLLSTSIKIMGKSNLTLRTSIALLALAEACKILADALIKFGSMSWDKIGKGLTAMGIALAEFTAALAVLSKVGGGGALLGSVALLIASKSLDELSENLKRLGSMSWDEIGRGLSAMGGALGEFVLALSVLSKVGGFGSVLGGTALLIAVQSLDEISENLKQLGSMSWDEIGRGLSAMGGALAEFTAALGILSKVGGFGSVLGGTALLIAAQSLDEISESLERTSSLSWDEIAKGLASMLGALTSIGLVSGALGKLTGFSGLIGAGTLVLGVQALEPLFNAFEKFGSLEWDEIGRGLVGMGGALTELATISGLLGKLGGFSGLIGAGTLVLSVQALEPLADSFMKFGSMSWDEIGRGLVGMGGALAEVAVISGLLGNLGGFMSLVGAGSILLMSQGLGQIADALIKFGSMSWDQASTGIKAMGDALAELSWGGFLNTLSIIGSASIAISAKPLGDLANSVKKWSDVIVPDGLGSKLAGLAGGITSFTLSIIGAGSIALVAEPLGVLADSVSKWKDVTIPDDIGEKLSKLADGVTSFTLAFIGGFSVSTVAEPLGALADSMKKWSDVTFPDGLEGNLKSIASGINAFSIFSDWKINDIAAPLGDLATAVSKWKDVSVPKGLEEDLKKVADGINHFSVFSNWKINDVAEPLSALGTALHNWNGIYISSKIVDDVSNVVTSMKNLKTVDFNGLASDTISSAIGNIKNLISTINSMGSVDPAGISTFGNALTEMGKISIDGLVNELGKGSAQVNFAITSLIRSMSVSLATNTILVTSSAANLGQEVGKRISAGLNVSISAIPREMTPIVFTAISSLVNQFGIAIAQNAKRPLPAIKSMIISMVNAINTGYSDFHNAGAYLVIGFANGIYAYQYRAEAQARAMAASAATAARKELDEHSPSKVGYQIGAFFGVAFVNALGDYSSKAYKAGTDIASQAKTGLSSAMTRVEDLLDSDMDMQPRIRPVLDLSSIRADVGALNGMFGMTPSIKTMTNLNAISAMSSRRNQNGTSDIVSAIRDLNKKFDNLPSGDTYSIGGVTYQDGSDVSNAIKVLIRAMKMEGRV